MEPKKEAGFPTIALIVSLFAGFLFGILSPHRGIGVSVAALCLLAAGGTFVRLVITGQVRQSLIYGATLAVGWNSGFLLFVLFAGRYP